jgi:hypothetical protein
MVTVILHYSVQNIKRSLLKEWLYHFTNSGDVSPANVQGFVN